MSSSRTAVVHYSDAQRREAAEWFVVIRDEDDPNADTLQGWLRWMEATEGNRVAFEAVAQAWHATPTVLASLMPTARELAADSYDGEQPVNQWLASQAQLTRRQRANWAWAAAASVAAIGLLLYTASHYLLSSTAAADEFVTKTGEQIEITLADGSHVSLGAKSRLLVAFTKERRAVRLDAGEAFFSVRKDRSRPFTVHAISGDITAVGTAFDVRAVADRMTVAVTEGVVSVMADSQYTAAARAAVQVASGQQLTIDSQQPQQALTVMQSPNPGERARWREGVLVYRDEPLRDVVADVARYSNQQLEITDDSVGALHFSGVVYKNAVDEWAAALPESFPVKLVSQGGRLTITAR
ncbi:MAG TPA: FecR domain-containing protein [Steroidobacteraceae bacterium]